jgi:hypothetical protein
VAVRVDALAGTWRRTLLVDERRTVDVTTEVTWLQGARTYLDLRRPPGRPAFDGVRRLADLDADQVRWLAGQEGFAGELTDRGDHVEWTRWVDLHPAGQHPDAGTLHLADGVLVERGRHVDYLEHWRRMSPAAAPTWALLLVGADGGSRACLLRVGSAFGWARGRRRRLCDPRPLPALVAAALADAGLDRARDAVDVEISLGTVHGPTEWTVTASTLPFREGAPLDLSLPARPAVGDTVTGRELSPTGDLVDRRWTVAHVEGEVVG